MSPNRSTILTYVEAFNAGDMESLRRLHTDDAIVRGVLGWGTIDQALAIWRMLHDALAIELTIEAIIEAGDTLAVRYTERGRSVGEFRGQQPTGKTYELVAMEWFEMHEGRIRRRWGARDSGTQMKQLDLQPL